MGLEIFFFLVLAFVVVVTSVLVITLRNPVYSGVSLLGTFLGVAGLFALCHASMLAMVQVMVYAAAVMVLLLFVVMLLGLKGPRRDVAKWTVTKALAGLMVLFVLVTLVTGAASIGVEGQESATVFSGLSRLAEVPTAEQLRDATGADREVLRRQVMVWERFGSAGSVGGVLFTRWLLAFEMVGLLLVASIAGAVVMAKRRL